MTENQMRVFYKPILLKNLEEYKDYRAVQGIISTKNLKIEFFLEKKELELFNLFINGKLVAVIKEEEEAIDLIERLSLGFEVKFNIMKKLQYLQYLQFSQFDL